jgi:hypothetical protein
MNKIIFIILIVWGSSLTLIEQIEQLSMINHINSVQSHWKAGVNTYFQGKTK